MLRLFNIVLKSLATGVGGLSQTVEEALPPKVVLTFRPRASIAKRLVWPHRVKAAELFSQAKDLNDNWREKRKTKSLSDAELASLEQNWKAVERAARESLAEGAAIEDAVYDLKAVNPNRAPDEDRRSPSELLDFIGAKGREADAALHRLRELISSSP